MPLVTDIGLIAKSAESSGADALIVANTFPAIAMDFRTSNSRLGSLTGGLSGPAIKPITLRLVWEVSKAVKIPILGLGGVETPADILEYISVGASAVQVGTASFSDPKASEAIINGLPHALNEANAISFNDIKGKFGKDFG